MRISLWISAALMAVLTMAAPATLIAETTITPAAKPTPAAKAAPASGTDTKSRPLSVVPGQGKEPVQEVMVEVRADGLAYLPGGKEPFTGTAITASKNFAKCVDTITPYRNGKRHGEVMTLYKAGNPKTVKTYADGVPKKQVAYYQDGAKKFEQTLNEKDRAEGPYRRWFPSGRLQAEASYDGEERFQGDVKEYTEDGKPDAHYVFEHGTIQKIIFETPAAKARREAPPAAPARK